MLQLGVLGPVLVEDEKDLLRAAEGEDGKEDASSTLDDGRDEICGGREVRKEGRRVKEGTDW